MLKYLLIIFLFLTVFCGSCDNYAKKIDKKIDDNIAKWVDDGTVNIPKLMIANKLNIMIPILTLGLFSGIILTFSGVRVIGLGVIVASITCIILLITLSLYMKWVALGGVIVLLIGFYFLGKALYDRSVVHRQLVGTVEMAKTLIPEDKKETLSKSLKRIQTKATKSIVSRIKKE